MAIEKELLDQLLAGREPNEVFAKDGLLVDLKKALSERILNAELDERGPEDPAGPSAQGSEAAHLPQGIREAGPALRRRGP